MFTVVIEYVIKPLGFVRAHTMQWNYRVRPLGYTLVYSRYHQAYDLSVAGVSEKVQAQHNDGASLISTLKNWQSVSLGADRGVREQDTLILITVK